MWFRPRQTVADLLRQFPGPVVLAWPEFVRFLSMGPALLGAASAVYWLMQLSLWKAGICAFLAYALAFGRVAVTLDGDGFEVVSFFFRKRYRWCDAREFAAPSYAPTMVTFSDDGQTPIRGWMERRLVSPKGFVIDTSMLALNSREVASLMNAWRERAVARDTCDLRPPLISAASRG